VKHRGLDQTPSGIVALGGNVAEWCRDTYEAGYYRKAPAENPFNSTPGQLKSVRGASYRMAKPFDYRAARRVGVPANHPREDIGIRLVLGK